MKDIKKVKAAVVGCGAISNIYLINLTRMFTILEVAAVCDVRKEAAQQAAEKYGVSKVLTMEEILSDPEIELVVNLTGPAIHYDIIKQCLKAGKHVYTEKTLCVTIEQGRELLALADEKGLYLGAAPDTFLGAGLQTARKVLDAGMIGEVRSVVSCINRNQLLMSEGTRFMRTPGGSLPYDVGIYYLTALLSLFGPVSKVTGFTRTPKEYEGKLCDKGTFGEKWGFESANSMALSLQFENGILGSFHVEGESINVEQPHIAVYGTEGILFLGDPNTFSGPVKLLLANGSSCEIPFTHGFDGVPLQGDPYTFQISIYGNRGIGVAELAWALREKRTPRASKEMAFHAVEVLCGGEIACKEEIVYDMTSSFTRPAPLPSGFMNSTFGGMVPLDAEGSLAG